MVDIIICVIYLWCIKKKIDQVGSSSNAISDYDNKKIVDKVDIDQVEGEKDNAEKKLNPGLGDKNREGMLNGESEVFYSQKEQLPFNLLTLA